MSVDLNKLVRESVMKILEEKEGGVLLEMAYDRGRYKSKIDDRLPQILTNWCLVRYCSIVGNEKNRNHWLGELRGLLSTVARYSLRGNNSVSSRLSVLEEIWDENDFSIPNNVNLEVSSKFMNEGINIDSEEYVTAVVDCIESKDDIFKAILSKDIRYIQSYIDSI